MMTEPWTVLSRAVRLHHAAREAGDAYDQAFEAQDIGAMVAAGWLLASFGRAIDRGLGTGYGSIEVLVGKHCGPLRFTGDGRHDTAVTLREAVLP